MDGAGRIAGARSCSKKKTSRNRTPGSLARCLGAGARALQTPANLEKLGCDTHLGMAQAPLGPAPGLNMKPKMLLHVCPHR